MFLDQAKKEIMHAIDNKCQNKAGGTIQTPVSQWK